MQIYVYIYIYIYFIFDLTNCFKHIQLQSYKDFKLHMDFVDALYIHILFVLE